MKINSKKLVSAFIVLIPIALSLETKYSVGLVQYFDEMGSLFFLFFLLSLAIKRKLEKTDQHILMILSIITVLGLLSNLVSGLIKFGFPILIDAFVQWKIFVCFLGAKYISSRDSKRTIIKRLLIPSKIIIIIGAVFGLISQFIDLDMSADGAVRYGIKAYSFLLGNEGRYGIVIAVALLVILCNIRNRKQRALYEILAFVNMLLTTKGVVYILLAFYIMLKIIFSHIERKEKLNFKTIFPTVLIGIAVSGFQIREYLLNRISPRMLLIRYGFITANDYFPLGSGFATYGSDQAARNYSPLYVKYGWTYRYAMGIENGSALNDNYLATIVGEIGYIGLLLFLILLFLIFKQINAIRNIDSKCKSLVLSIFLCLMVCFIATGIMKSSIGVMAFTVLGVIKGYSYVNKEINR